MKRNIDIKEISDGKLYGPNDMVKADCRGCEGCSACCHGMGTSIVLTPLDIYRLEKELNASFGELMTKGVELNLADGKKTQSGPFTLLPRTEMPEDNDMQSRYGMLNEMCRAFVQKKETEFKAQAEEYLKKESLAEHFLPVR